MSEDPGTNGGNWFVYCDDDPVNYGDYSGAISLQVNRLYKWKGYTYRLDYAGDLHVWFKGQFLGAIYRSLTYKHGGKGIPKSFLKHLAKRTDFFSKAPVDGGVNGLVCIAAISSVDAYAQVNPFDFIELMVELFNISPPDEDISQYKF